MLFGIGGVVCLWYFCWRGACRRKGRESMSIVDGCKSCTAVTRWHCVRHVPSGEKTSLAVGRGVAEPSHRESGPRFGHNARFLSASDIYIEIYIYIYIWKELIDIACSGIEQGLRKHRGKKQLLFLRFFRWLSKPSATKSFQTLRSFFTLR